MTALHTIIMGIVEGITEFLPVSSTAHLEIAQALLRIPSTDFVKSFEIFIQLGAILAVAVLYLGKIFSSRAYFRSVLIAFIPTGIIGLALYKVIKHLFLGNVRLAALMLVLGGLLIVMYERRAKKRGAIQAGETRPLGAAQAFAAGTAQALAVVPGVSRSAAVIVSGRMMGLSRSTITEFSFLLAIPTMLAASGYDLYKSGFAFSAADWRTLGLGFIVSFAVALLVVRWLLRYIRSHSFEAFGWYRMALGALVLVFAFAGSASAYTYQGVLKLGSTGSAVTSLQVRLGIAQTGDFDYATRAAVANFQYQNGLAADGIVGPVTGKALARAASAPPAPAAPAPVPSAPDDASYQAGCSAGTLYSATTGLACDAEPLFPAGCDSTSGYSPTTGLSCALPIGCMADTAYSAYTGESCQVGSSSSSSSSSASNKKGGYSVSYYGASGITGTNDVTLAGGSGSIDHAAVLSYFDGSHIAENVNGAFISGYTITAGGSDILITSVKVSFEKTAGSASARLSRYAETVYVYLDGSEVGEAAASDFSSSGGVYTDTIPLTGAVIGDGDDANLYIGLATDRNISSSDADNTWTVRLLQARYTDGLGARLTNSSTGDIGGDGTEFHFVPVDDDDSD